MNIEDFVTYEQALALKKLGFDERCLYYYNVNEQIVANERDYQEEVSVKDLYISYNSEYTSYNRIDAPTLAQAQKWLRKEKNLCVCSEIDIVDTEDNKYFWTIYKLPSKKQIWKTISFDSPEEALSAGITECLKILEK